MSRLLCLQFLQGVIRLAVAPAFVLTLSISVRPARDDQDLR